MINSKGQCNSCGRDYEGQQLEGQVCPADDDCPSHFEEVGKVHPEHPDYNMNQPQHLTHDGHEINEVTWTCNECKHDNKDLMKETLSPICCGCGKPFGWPDININVSTYFGGEETQAKLSELVFIDKAIADSGIVLSKQNVKESKFNKLIPVEKLAAYFGSFGEYVPIVFENR